MAAETDLEKHFVDIMRDLDNRLTNLVDSREYDVIQLSAVLRKLLLDGVINRANSRIRTPLRYRVALYDGPGLPANLRPDFHAVYAELYPDSVAPEHWIRHDLKLAEFLALPLLHVRGEMFTVRDIIDLAANALGGVHFGDPRDKRLEALRQANDSRRVGGMRPIAGHLVGIAEVTRRAVQALRKALEKPADDLER